MKTTRTPEQKCPTCATTFSAATSVGNDSQPKPGDISVCIRCGEVLQFGDGLVVRVVGLNARLRRALGPAGSRAVEKIQRFVREGKPS